VITRATNTLESGRVMRYHAAPTVQAQQLGLHAWGVAVIALYLTEGEASKELLVACVLHDAAELITGDVPFTVKRNCRAAKELYAQLEEDAHEHHVLGMPQLTVQEEAILKLADTIEGLLWCRKTETNGPVADRWRISLDNAFSKFSTVLSQDIIARAGCLATNSQLFPQ
jgi:5'-deoxynucleotidase YfbR-like HD superfamily hydrolase